MTHLAWFSGLCIIVARDGFIQNETRRRFLSGLICSVKKQNFRLALIKSLEQPLNHSIVFWIVQISSNSNGVPHLADCIFLIFKWTRIGSKNRSYWIKDGVSLSGRGLSVIGDVLWNHLTMFSSERNWLWMTWMPGSALQISKLLKMLNNILIANKFTILNCVLMRSLITFTIHKHN